MVTASADTEEDGQSAADVDEADKLSDQVLYFFITLNKLEDHCGIVLMATDYLQKKITRASVLTRRATRKYTAVLGTVS